MTLGHAASAFLEQVGKDALVNHRDVVNCVTHSEAHGQPVVVALQRALLDQATDSKISPDWRLLCDHLRWAEKEYEVFLKSVKYQSCGDPETGDAQTNKPHSFMSRLHFTLLLPSCSMRSLRLMISCVAAKRSLHRP